MGKKVDEYFPAAVAGGIVSVLLIVAYLYLFVLSPADWRAIYVDGFAIVYIPIALFIFAIPGAIAGAVFQFVRARKS